MKKQESYSFISQIKYLFICLTLIFCIHSDVIAQQFPQFTQYLFNPMPYNPAYTGSETGLHIDAAFRAQWLGVEGRPLTQSLAAHLPIPRFRSGFGIVATNDLLGAERHTALYVQYSYLQKLGGVGLLSIGISAGAIQKNVDGGRLISPTGDYNSGVNHNDNLIPVSSQSGFAPDFGIGVLFKTSRLQIGLSALHLLEPSIRFDTAETTVDITNSRTFFVNSSYLLDIGNVFTLQPSVLFKTDLAQFQGDIHVMATYNENYQLGVGIRGITSNSLDAVALIAGLRLTPKWQVIYSYDFPISGLKNFTSGSHELTAKYRLRTLFKAKGSKKMYNPRFL